MRELCWGLATAGVEVCVATTLHGYDPSVDRLADEELLLAGATVSYFPVHPWPWLGQRYAYSPGLGAFLRQTLKIDLVHLHGLWQYPITAAAQHCQKADIPYVVSPCGALDPYGLKRRAIFKGLYGLFVERRTLGGAAAVHFTSEAERRSAYLFGTNRPAFVIPRSIRMDKVPRLPIGTFRTLHPEIGDRRILLFLGRLHAKKRLDIVAESFARVALQRSDIHLVVAGPDDGMGEKVRRLLKRYRLLERATFTGFLSGQNKWAAFHDSDLFLLPSEDENFGRSVLEAMAASVPVLISDQVGLAPAVAQAKAGVVLERNATLWAITIERLLDEPSTRKAMGEAGRQLVLTEFSSNQVSVKMKKMYDSVRETRL